MDLKDKKILYILSQDASLSYSQIARLTRLSRDVVAYRIARLEEDGLIKAYKLSVNYKILGFSEYDVYIKLTGVDEARQKEIIADFEKNRLVSWIGICFGNYDLRVSIQARSNEQLQSILSSILSRYPENIRDHEVVSLTKKYKLNEEFFILELFKELREFKLPQKRLSRIDIEGDVVLDDADKKLIRLLGKSPESSLVELSRMLGMTPEGVKYKIERLRQKGVIRNVYAIVDGNSLGRMWCTFVFRLRLDAGKEKEIERYLLTMKNATSAVRLLGKWDLGLTIYASSIKDVQHSLNDFKNHFKDIIKDYESLVILDIYKYPRIAEGVLD